MRFIKFGPLILLIMIVFISSATPYQQQTIVPTLMKLLPGEPLIGPLSLLHIPYYGMDISVESRGYYYFLEFLVRKFAHLTAFGAMAIAVYIALPKKNYRYLLAIGITFLFACADELHQYFTVGRTASGQDVLLDTVGGLLWLTIFVLILRKIRAKKKETPN